MGRGRERRTCIAYTRYVSPPRDPTKRNDSRPSSGDRGRLRGSGCHTEFAGLLQRRERGRVAWIRGRRQADSPRAHSRDRRSCATPPTMCRCRRSPIVPRIGVAAYRLSRARDRSITDKLRFTYVRYAHAARTDVDVGFGDVGLLYARAHTHREPRVDTVDETSASPRLRGA